MAINPNLRTTGTILTMTSYGDGVSVLPFYSARGITQTLVPIDAAFHQRRTINFEQVDLALPRSRKYMSTISARDVRPPSRDDVWPGRKVLVGCCYRLMYPTAGGAPARDPVSGSQVVEGLFTHYYPVITFMLGKPEGRFDEWQAGYEWSIPMQEV